VHYVFFPDRDAPAGWAPQLVTPPPFTECIQVTLGRADDDHRFIIIGFEVLLFP